MAEEEIDLENLSGEESGLVYGFAAAPGFTPGQHGIAFAALSTGLLKTDDGGQTWQDALAALNLSEPVPVTSLVIAPDFTHAGSVEGNPVIMGIGITVTPGDGTAKHRDGFEIRIEESCGIVSNPTHKMQDNRIEDGGDKENNSDNNTTITRDDKKEKRVLSNVYGFCLHLTGLGKNKRLRCHKTPHLIDSLTVWS